MTIDLPAEDAPMAGKAYCVILIRQGMRRSCLSHTKQSYDKQYLMLVYIVNGNLRIRTDVLKRLTVLSVVSFYAG